MNAHTPIPIAERSLTDVSIIRRLKLNDNHAAEELYKRYAQRISALARSKISNSLLGRSDEDDVVQSVFRVVFEKAREGALFVPDGNTLWELLAVVTVNKVRSLTAFHTALRRDSRSTVSWQECEFASEICKNQEQLTLAVKDILQTFPKEFADVIDLRLQGHHVEDIAKATGRSLRSTERVLQSCRDHLETVLAAQNAN